MKTNAETDAMNVLHVASRQSPLCWKTYYKRQTSQIWDLCSMETVERHSRDVCTADCLTLPLRLQQINWYWSRVALRMIKGGAKSYARGSSVPCLHSCGCIFKTSLLQNSRLYLKASNGEANNCFCCTRITLLFFNHNKQHWKPFLPWT